MSNTPVSAYTKPSYIEDTAPRGFGPKTLFIYPFHEAVRNLSEVKCQNLIGRVAHIVVGLALFVPLLNTIIFLALRAICCQPISGGNEYPINPPAVDQPREDQIAELNQERDQLRQAYADEQDTVAKSQINGRIRNVERRAAGLIYKEGQAWVEYHLILARRNSSLFARYDGNLAPRRSVRHRNYSLKQIPCLSQQVNGNAMCAYYALFFMMKAVTTHRNDSFLDRTGFNGSISNWVEHVANKRGATRLGNMAQIPIGLHLDLEGLSLDGDVLYLINNSQTLVPLRNNPQCFLLDMEALEYSRCLSEENLPDPSQPLFFMVKKGGHFYFVYTRSLERGHFYAVDSTNGRCAPLNQRDFHSIIRWMESQHLIDSQRPLRLAS